MGQPSYKLNGRGLELAKVITDEWMSMNLECAKIEADAIRAISARKEASKEIVMVQMAILFEEVGLPKEAQTRYMLDGRYINVHGDAYLVEHTPETVTASDGRAVIDMAATAPPGTKFN